MSALVFERNALTIRMVDQAGALLAGPFAACNNVDSTSKGIWPDGTFPYIAHVPHSKLSDPESAYGEDGILQFLVPGRPGMGVHSGRRDIPDGRGRKGPAHCTMGCIRTTDEAMAAFLGAMKADAIKDIAVGV